MADWYALAHTADISIRRKRHPARLKIMKARGHISTPPLLAQQIPVHAAGVLLSGVSPSRRT